MPVGTMPRRWFLAALIALLLGAFAVRLLTFERYLPYMDHKDEPAWFLIGQNWRGATNDEWVDWRYQGVPPVYAVVNATVQNLVDVFVPTEWTTPPQHYYTLRLAAVFIGVVTTAFIVMFGMYLAGPLAGWFAGLIWAFAPAIVEWNSLALPDPIVYLTTAASLAFAARGWRTRDLRWLLASYVAGVLCVFTKGWPAHVMLPWGIIMLIWSIRRPRRYLPWLVAGIVVFALAMVFLWFVYGGSGVPAPEVDRISNSALANIFDFSRQLNNWWWVFKPFGLPLFFLITAGGIVAYIYHRSQKERVFDWIWIIALIAQSAVGVSLASTFIRIWDYNGIHRHVLPSTIALIGLWSAFLAQIVWALRSWSKSKPLSRSIQRLLVMLIPGLVLLTFGLPAIRANVDLIQDYQKTDIHQILWEWSDTSVPNEGLILMTPHDAIERTWNRAWGGYNGSTPFEWWFEDAITNFTPQEYIERGIIYYAAEGSPGPEEFVSQLMLLRTIQPTEEIVGPAVHFYRMAGPQVASGARFGAEIALVGYDLTTAALAPGESVTFRPYWQAIQPPAADYSMFVHLYPAEEVRLIAQYDGAPGAPRRPTITWDDPQEVHIGPRATLTIPAETPPGDYVLAVGLYDYTSGARLALEDGADWLAISLRVE